jgi:predicted nucleotide-binding protein
VAARGRKLPPTVPPSLPPARGAQLLRTQVEKGKQLLGNRPITSSANQTWETVTQDVLIRVFGSDSPNVSSVMDVGHYGFVFGDATEEQYESARAENLATRLEILEGLIELLESESGVTGAHAPSVASGGRRVFLVHGHNKAATEETARFLEKLGLDVTILQEKASEGRTVIEKFEGHSDVQFAVALMTGDDRGGTVSAPYKEQNPRARQNVILELGFFLGKLGRKRVCALYEQGVEIPSDYSGVVFVPRDVSGAWRLTLAREIKAAGLEVDLNKAV